MPSNIYGTGSPSWLGFNSDAPPVPQSTPATARQTNQPAAGYNPFWNDEPDLWDTVTLNGIDLPGLCKVTGDVGRKIQVRRSPGSDGSTLADRGYDTKPIKILLVMWTSDQHNTWEGRVLPIINPRRDTTRRQPLEIFHPALNQLGIRRVVVKNISILRDGSIPQTKETEIECYEFTRVVSRGTIVQHPPALGTIPTAGNVPTSPNAPPAPPPAPSTTSTP